MRRSSTSAGLTQDTPPRAWGITLPFRSPHTDVSGHPSSTPILVFPGLAAVRKLKSNKTRMGVFAYNTRGILPSVSEEEMVR